MAYKHIPVVARALPCKGASAFVLCVFFLAHKKACHCGLHPKPHNLILEAGRHPVFIFLTA